MMMMMMIVVVVAVAAEVVVVYCKTVKLWLKGYHIVKISYCYISYIIYTHLIYNIIHILTG